MPLTPPTNRSFVRRDSRITRAQKFALEQNWLRFAMPNCTKLADLADGFQRRAPVTLEIGSGDGACVLQLAAQKSAENFFAVEVYRPGLGRLLHQAAIDNLTNIRVADQDICELLARVSEPVFDQVLIFFPDPWPKKRHHKRRLLQSEFFNLLEPCLHRHGRMFIATDSASYAESILETINGLPNWVNLAGSRRQSPRAKFRPVTKFEQKARSAGASVYDFALARR